MKKAFFIVYFKSFQYFKKEHASKGGIMTANASREPSTAVLSDIAPDSGRKLTSTENGDSASASCSSR